MDASYAFAENLVNLKARDIPPEVAEITKKCILDILGCIFAAGQSSADSQSIIDLFMDAGGSKEATVIGHGKKLPVWSAAFANALLAHALDFDDVVDETAVHPSLCSVPTALALAEKVGGVSGAELITAIALGNDLISRLGAAIKKKQEGLVLGFRPAPVLGIFGAAAAAGRVLGLKKEQIVDCLGIAFHQGASGTFEVFLSPGDTKIREYYGGFIAWNGVISALMAQRGVTGIKTCFEGPAGLLNLYFQGKYDREYLIADLGKRFEGVNVSLKPWSANRAIHAHLQAALDLIHRNNIAPENIDRITLFLTESQKRFFSQAGQKPVSGTEARVSLTFCLASAVSTGGLSLRNFTPGGLSDPPTLQLAEKVVSEDITYGDLKSFFPPGKVSIRLKSDEVFTNQINQARGHPSNPMSFEDVANKFSDCVAQSRSPGQIKKIIEAIKGLETIRDMRAITVMLK
jgi:2-methylcitrate dehydratase PrpD